MPLKKDAPKVEGTPTATWIPSRKWIAAQVTGLGTLATSAIATGWGDAEWTGLVALGVAAATSYLIPNAS